jgi:hypothetical protein
MVDSCILVVLGYMKQSREVGSDGSPLSGVNGVTAEQVELPLTEGALSVNYGVPLAVVCCKVRFGPLLCIVVFILTIAL